LQLTVDGFGVPVVSSGPLGETLTEVREEPTDPIEPPEWSRLDTATKASSDENDDFRTWADTVTRSSPDPADPQVISFVLAGVDDPVTGVVAF